MRLGGAAGAAGPAESLRGALTAVNTICSTPNGRRGGGEGTGNMGVGEDIF